VDNRQVEATLNEIAQILQLKGTNAFKIRAYENAARSIAQLQEDVNVLVAEKRLKKVRGVGKSIQEKVTELVETGELTYLEELREGIPQGLFEVLKVPGLGPKKVKALWDELGVTTLEELKTACDEHRIEGLKGFGKKSEENILKGLANLARAGGRRLRADVLPVSRELKAMLEALDGVEQVEVGGSLRRGRETVKDVDLLVASRDPAPVMAAVRDHPQVDEIIGSGETKTSVRLQDGLQVDVRVVEPESYACALAYFTGSKAFNVAVRGLALDLGYSLNEYNLRPLDGSEPPALASEEELFAKLGLAYVPPEMRENTGEVDLAKEGDLPRLLEPEDLQGILHVHTTWSDGAHSVEDMVAEAEGLGYGYIGISDHSVNARYANGLDAERIEAQKAEIEAAREAHPGIRVLHGIEADILPDGTLDLPDDCLAGLDFVIASVHQALNQNREDMTARLVKAVSHPAVKVLGHPQNRKMPERDVSEFDWEAVLDAAEEHGVAIELNAHPRRLDADWVHVRRIRERGIKLCVNPDAHSMDGLDYAKVHGVVEARRGWARREDVVNTLPTQAFVTEFLGLSE
jgi:DNA polymerase (family 10)